MAKSESNDLDLQDIWDESRLDDVPFWGSANELLEYGNILDNCLERVRTSQSARDIVLEAWLALDYSIRTLVLAAFELTDYNDQDFDLRTKLLPESHRALLHILDLTVKHYSSLAPEPISDHLKGYAIPIDYIVYLRREKKELLQKLLDLQTELNDEYYTFRHPGRKKPNPLLSITTQSDKVSIHPRKRVHPGWLAAAMNLDDSWLKLDGQLNNARNAAAHSVDAKRIGACFGITGPDALERIRAKCLDALSTLLAVKNSNKLSD